MEHEKGAQLPARRLAEVGGSSRSSEAGISSRVSLALASPRAPATVGL